MMKLVLLETKHTILLELAHKYQSDRQKGSLQILQVCVWNGPLNLVVKHKPSTATRRETRTGSKNKPLFCAVG